MKKILILFICAFTIISCNVFKKESAKNGCPPNVKNMGAEKLMMYQQQGYTPKTAQEKREYEMAMKELKKNKPITKEAVNTKD